MTARTLEDVLAWLREGSDPIVREHFTGDAPLIVARAPGRLDVMGGIADYSGSLVLQLPLEVATTAIVQPCAERRYDLHALDAPDERLRAFKDWLYESSAWQVYRLRGRL